MHLPGEVDPSLIGDWRGLYAQKNTAGAVCVMTALLFLFSRNGRGNWIGWLVAAAATGFLVMTRSKTSLGLFPVALLAGMVYRHLLARQSQPRDLPVRRDPGPGADGGHRHPELGCDRQLLADPTGFTGRAEIWQAMLAYMRDHPWLGAGFGTMAHTGALSPLHNYARGNWVEAIADSHNGYLQILVTTGRRRAWRWRCWAWWWSRCVRFWPLEPARTGFKALLFALFVFVLLHNFLETDFLESDNTAWFAFLVMLREPAQSATNSLTLRS